MKKGIQHPIPPINQRPSTEYYLTRRVDKPPETGHPPPTLSAREKISPRLLRTRGGIVDQGFRFLPRSRPDSTRKAIASRCKVPQELQGRPLPPEINVPTQASIAHSVNCESAKGLDLGRAGSRGRGNPRHFFAGFAFRSRSYQDEAIFFNKRSRHRVYNRKASLTQNVTPSKTSNENKINKARIL